MASQPNYLERHMYSRYANEDPKEKKEKEMP